MTEREDKTALTYWLPKLESARIPSPRTIIVPMRKEAQASLWAAFDGREDGDPKPFFGDIERAARDLGFPCFLRTTHTSGKHNWEHTCYLARPEDIPSNVYGIAEYSELAGFPGLPWDIWAVRAFLPTKPLGVCKDYGNMPLCREFRFFVHDGVVRCWHPYWPKESLEQGGAVANDGRDVDALFADLSHAAEPEAMIALAQAAGEAVGGAWSIDLLETSNGWFVTDMAEAEKSWHWPGCELLG